MKSLKNNFLLKALALGGLVTVAMSSCQEEEGNVIDYSPGNALAISGASSAYVGDTEGYYLNMNDVNGDYSWSIESGASVSENSENDAYVSVAFDSPGAYSLAVSKGDASGSKSIEVSSRELNFNADSLTRGETIMNDTLDIPLSITGGFNGDFTVSYSISGSMDVSGYDVVAGYESPYTVDTDSTNSIKLVIYPDATTESDDIIVTIDDISPVMDDEYVAADTLQTIVYSFWDDSKMASINTDSVELESPGVYSYPVTLSNPAGGDMTVSYTISAGVGFSDATATDLAGTIDFSMGESEKHITLSVSEAAFAADQEVEITLTGVVGGGAEASIDGESDTKVIVIDVE